TVMTLAGGALFGLVRGVLLVSFASSIGATLAFLAARFLLRDWVQKRYRRRLQAVNDGIEKDGAWYLFSLRLVPVFPFFVINLVMGLTPMRTVTFYAISQIGMLAGTVVYVYAGTRIAAIDHVADVFSPGLIAALVLLGLFPLIARKLMALFQARRGRVRHTLMADAATLSIVVPVYREATIVAGALQALAPLRRRGAEVIVVDGGSDDDTLALARPYADRAFVAGRGRATQMNAGARVARGDILLFLHADTRLPAAADDYIKRGLADSARVWGRFDVHIDGGGAMLAVIAALMNRRSRLTGIATGDQAVFTTRAAFARVGGFPEQALMEDIAICRRLKRLSPPLCLRARVATSGRRWTRQGLLQTVALMWGLRAAYFCGVSPARLALWYRHVRS
ncbi:TIGR04283 family arsenosugar biosynthesis glycosyltransferase, partial [Salinisphaera sp.]|uniref:TIGR04283 family arsenosugar biosynthesis glycosyltransferase n=1 Tax=Salinisphaera sp. TaxID=1914330 RepID=UPI002D796D4E